MGMPMGGGPPQDPRMAAMQGIAGAASGQPPGSPPGAPTPSAPPGAAPPPPGGGGMAEQIVPQIGAMFSQLLADPANLNLAKTMVTQMIEAVQMAEQGGGAPTPPAGPEGAPMGGPPPGAPPPQMG